MYINEYKIFLSDSPQVMIIGSELETKIDPPIQTEYHLSGGATTFTSTPSGTSEINSLLNLSFRPGNIVDPPDNTILL